MLTFAGRRLPRSSLLAQIDKRKMQLFSFVSAVLIELSWTDMESFVSAVLIELSWTDMESAVKRRTWTPSQLTRLAT